MQGIADNWWILWGVVAAAFIIWRGLVRRGGSEPLLRRIVWVARPRIDPQHPSYDAGLPFRLMLFATGGVALAMLALLLLEVFN